MYLFSKPHILGMLLLTILSHNIVYAQNKNDATKQYADHLYKISKFVTWPSYIMNQHSLVFCLYGHDINEVQYQHINGKLLHEKSVHMVKLNNIENAQDCQLIFTTEQDEKTLKVLSKLSKENAILTISPHKAFLLNGGIIRLNLEHNQQRIEINQEHAQASNLSIHSSLLNLSKPTDSE